MMLVRTYVLVLAMCAWTITSYAVEVAKRCTVPKNCHAFIVGINDYERFPDLLRAENDARAVEDVFVNTLGFSRDNVRRLAGANATTLRAIKGAWKRFLENIKEDDIVVVFYAGHGMSLNGANYLLPSDMPVTVAATSLAVNLNDMIKKLVKLKDNKPKLSVFIIDACRDNPLVKTLSPPGKTENDASLVPGRLPRHAYGDRIPVPHPAAVGGYHGAAAYAASNAITLAGSLVQIIDSDSRRVAGFQPPDQVFVMYSAGIDQQALDGGGLTTVGQEELETSIFTTQLVRKLKSGPDRGLVELARAVRFAVYLDARDATESESPPHTQTPAIYAQLGRPFTILGEDADITKTFPRDPRPAGRALSYQHRDAIIECAECLELVVMDPAKHKWEGLKDRFAIGRTEVTIGEWNRVLGIKVDGNCLDKADKETIQAIKTRNPGNDQKPATDVSWYMAVAFTKRLNCIVGLDQGKGPRYRLPSEAEWQFAARRNRDRVYGFNPGKRADGTPFASPEHELCRYANAADRSMRSLFLTNWRCDDKVARETAPVGIYRANANGLHDMFGNVWEWTENDCKAGGDGRCHRRKAHGGSWRSAPFALRDRSGRSVPASEGRPTVGFRVVRTLEK